MVLSNAFCHWSAVHHGGAARLEARNETMINFVIEGVFADARMK
jgi:hypothetical protein